MEFFGRLDRHPEAEEDRKRIMEEEMARRENLQFDFIKESDWIDGFGPFDGIISHLSKECGGNVHSKGVMRITANAIKLPIMDGMIIGAPSGRSTHGSALTSKIGQ